MDIIPKSIKCKSHKSYKRDVLPNIGNTVSAIVSDFISTM